MASIQTECPRPLPRVAGAAREATEAISKALTIPGEPVECQEDGIRAGNQLDSGHVTQFLMAPMMDQETLLGVWDAQLELFSRVAVEAGLEAKGHAGSRIAAQIFSEALARCVSLDSAKECVRSDPDGARSFLHQANKCNWLIYDHARELPSLPTRAVGPFPLVCLVVTGMLKRLQEFDPDNFE